ncbi:ciliated left-right organizer metallopeptidase-like isoform X2 [Antedon mediterranea]|uniref:ciliated left-right organizer metallopeptidase-like isoform X2 n=1 Tax=Antedon mediterranea TaxID=105859 RepID=UPI003AF7323B
MNYVLWFSNILIILSMVESHQQAVHKCIHDEQPTTHVHSATLNYADPTRNKRDASAVYKNIRITPYYYDISKLNSERQDKVVIAVEKASNLVQHVLSVIPVVGTLIFQRTLNDYCSGILSSGINQGKCSLAQHGYAYEVCDSVQIPDDHLEGAWLWDSTQSSPVHEIKPQGSGLQKTDVVIYVTSIDCPSDGVLAEAKYCRVDQNGRPVAGVLNLCPHQLDSDLDILTTVTVHEMFHILGFTQHLYDKFRDCSDSETGLDCPIRENTLATDHNGQTVMLTPKVQQKAKEHFNCSQADFSVPLENQQSRSHWEMRVMAGSIMAPVITEAHVTFLDPITLALFEDTGWYKANFEHAQSMLWGMNAGCDFGLPDTCTDSLFFCTNESLPGCHYLHNDKASCSTTTYLDSCLLFKVTESCFVEKYVSEDSEHSEEQFGIGSKCFVSNLNQTSTEDDLRGQCYQTRCNIEQGTYEISVDESQWYTCQSDNVLSISGYSGQVHCPSFELICHNLSSILTLINTLPVIAEPSTLPPTTRNEETGLSLAKDDDLVIEVEFNDTSNSLDEQKDEEFLDAVNQMVLTLTNISQDRLEVYEMKIINDDIFVTLTIQHATPQCRIASYDVYNSLETAIESGNFIVSHNNQSLTAITISFPKALTAKHHTKKKLLQCFYWSNCN